jgi:hypothetical protein
MAVRKSLNQVLKALTPVGKGDNVYGVASAERINNIQDAIHLITRGDHIVSGVNVRKHSGDGFVLLSAQPRSTVGGGSEESQFPWQTTFSNEGTLAAPNYRVRVRPGTVGSILPEDIFDIDDSEAESAGLVYVKVKCESDGQVVNRASMVVNRTANEDVALTAENTVPPIFYDVVSVINIVDSTTGLFASDIFQIRSGNLDAVARVAFVVAKIPASVGEEPFTRWWNWQIFEE